LDVDTPIKTALYSSIPGFESQLNRATLDQAADVEDILVALQIATLTLAALEPQLAEGSKRNPEVRYFFDRVLHHRHPFDRDALFLPRVLAEAGLVSKMPQLPDRFPDEFRHAVYSLVRDVTDKLGDPEHMAHRLRDLLEYLHYRGRRDRREDGPWYSEFFLRILVQVIGGPPSKDASGWADRIRGALRYIR
jgi:hypothetical protein